jgi:hypothetical protein
LDFDFPDEMRNITYLGHFYKNGKPVFDAIMFTGTVGVYTGIKYGAFSVSENDRQPWRTLEALLQNMAMIFMGYDAISWIIRDAFVKFNNFECALNYL